MMAMILSHLRAGWRGYAFGLVAVALVTVPVGLVLRQTDLANGSSLYLIAVLITAAVYGRGPAVFASVAAFFAFDLFFVEPLHVFTPASPEQWATLLLFLLTALVTGQLAAALRQRAEDARQREREAVTLHEVARLVTGSPLELRPLLALILDQLRTVVEYHAAEIISIEGSEAVVLDYRGPLPREQVVGFRLPPQGALMELVEEVARRRGPVMREDLGGTSLQARDLIAAGVPIPAEAVGQDRANLAVPLIVKGTVTGVQTLIHDRPGYYGERHAQLAMTFAQQAAAAIENARLFEQARGRAALEERQRLARELHDSVSQVLYGITLNAYSADELFESAPSRARGLLRDVLALAEAGLAEMRALIFELRPESLEREGLVAALEKQADAVQARHGVTIHAALTEEPDAPLAVKEVLYRIAQEALQNTTRHARARVVDLTLEADAGELVLRVGDDGRGFDPSGEFPGHLGLRSMRERAAGVGGTLEVDSAPGHGTRVCARVPLAVPG
jgi:signal transduction histidine kinase